AEAELQRRSGVGAAPQAIASADRRWERVDAELRQRVLAIHQAMAGQGYRMVLVEGYRSPGRQAELARQGGRTTLAGPGRSCHQYGLAVDSALYRDGRLQWDMADPWTRRGYALYGRLAADAGLEWGGSWVRLKDYVHVEMRDACRQARRTAGGTAPPVLLSSRGRRTEVAGSPFPTGLPGSKAHVCIHRWCPPEAVLKAASLLRALALAMLVFAATWVAVVLYWRVVGVEL